MSVYGLCHICGFPRQVDYCSLCKHYFCDPCRKRWAKRGLAAILELVGGKGRGKGKCWCGPERKEGSDAK